MSYSSWNKEIIDARDAHMSIPDLVTSAQAEHKKQMYFNAVAPGIYASKMRGDWLAATLLQQCFDEEQGATNNTNNSLDIR